MNLPCDQLDYVVVQFYPWFKFSLPLFQTHYHTLSYSKTKENKIQTKDKIKPQQLQQQQLYVWMIIDKLQVETTCKIAKLIKAGSMETYLSQLNYNYINTKKVTR